MTRQLTIAFAFFTVADSTGRVGQVFVKFFPGASITAIDLERIAAVIEFRWRLAG